MKTERTVKKLLKERTLEGDGRGSVTINPGVAQRQADLKSALDKGDIKGYIQKYLIKPVQSE